jgi:hypothetical protein
MAARVLRFLAAETARANWTNRFFNQHIFNQCAGRYGTVACGAQHEWLLVARQEPYPFRLLSRGDDRQNESQCMTRQKKSSLFNVASAIVVAARTDTIAH